VLYRHLAVTSDGGFVATGGTIINNTLDIVLIKTNGSGQEQWRKTYQKGSGYKVMLMPDGGYFMAAFIGSNCYGIKTDKNGASTTPDSKVFIANRALQSSGLRVGLEPAASLFDIYSPSFFVPADSNTTTMFAFSPWIAGRTNDGQLHIAAETYAPTDYDDYQSGPIGGSAPDFSRVWLAKKDQINALRRDYLVRPKPQ